MRTNKQFDWLDATLNRKRHVRFISVSFTYLHCNPAGNDLSSGMGETRMFAETRHLDSPTGATLAYHHSPAQGGARGVLLISHGLAEHSRRYEHFAEAMVAHALSCLRP